MGATLIAEEIARGIARDVGIGARRRAGRSIRRYGRVADPNGTTRFRVG